MHVLVELGVGRIGKDQRTLDVSITLRHTAFPQIILLFSRSDGTVGSTEKSNDEETMNFIDCSSFVVFCFEKECNCLYVQFFDVVQSQLLPQVCRR